jgi:hypothetical protein
MKRRSALAGLAAAYGRHLLRRILRPQPATSGADLLATYADDRLAPLTPSERGRLPAMSRCLGCGLCALVAGRVGGVRLPDLSSAYLRDATQLPRAAADLLGSDPSAESLAAAAAVCPVGVPLPEVAAAIRRLSGTNVRYPT